MEDILIGVILLILGLVAVIGKLDQKPRFVHVWFVVLATVFTAYYSYGGIVVFETGESNLNPLYVGVAMLFLALVLSKFIGEGKKARIGLVSLAFPLLFLLLGDTVYSFGGAGFTGLDLIKVSVLGAVVPVAFWIVFTIFRKVGFSMDNEAKEVVYTIESAFLFFFLFGVSIAGYFLAGPFGVFTALVTFLASSILLTNLIESGKKAVLPFVLLMLLLLPIYTLSQIGQADNVSLLQGKVLAGLFLGAMVTIVHAVMLVWSENVSGWLNKTMVFKLVIIPSFLVAISGGLYFVYESFGGTASVIAMLIGAGLTLPMTNAIFPNRNFASTTMLIGSAILIVPYLSHTTNELSSEIKGLSETTQRVVVMADDGSQKELDILDLNEAKGEWKVNAENSNLNFSIESNGTDTKGKFKTYDGQFSIRDTWQTARMQIEIPVKSISTFNAIRDKSLLNDADFFEEAKYPTITYKVNKLELTEDAYIAEGDFTMKGITKKVPFRFQFIGKGEREGVSFIVLKGSGKLNRLDFGMAPDPSIGNEVEFEFQTEFIAK